jgi:hypothetical protein
MKKRNLKEKLQESNVEITTPWENTTPWEKVKIYCDIDLYLKYKPFITMDDLNSISENEWAMAIKFNPVMFREFQKTWYATPSKIRKFLNIYPVLKLYI